MFLFKLTFLFLGFVYMTHGDSSSSTSSEDSQRSNSDDDNKLKQALALVDMLKTDYLRVLRENRALRQGISTTTPTPSPTDESTCAETSGEGNSTDPLVTSPPAMNANGSPSVNGAPSVNGTPFTNGPLPPTPNGAPPANIAPLAKGAPAGNGTNPADGVLPANLASDANIALPLTPSPSAVSDHRIFRRRMPEYYYGLDGQVLGPISGRRFMNLLEEEDTMWNNTTNFRRNMGPGDGQVLGPISGRRFMNLLEEEDMMWNNTTNFRRNMGPGDPVNLETPHGTKSSLPTSTPAAAMENTTYSRNSKSTTKVSRKVKAKGAKTTRATKKGLISVSSNKIKDILKYVNGSRIKDPLMDEIASELIMELKEEKYGLRANSSEATENKTSPSMVHVLFTKPKSSMRIHLFKSTRLSIPLNPNNAFCYYRPESMLCKTAIKK